MSNVEQMKLVAQLSLGRCEKCKYDKTVDCGCEASEKLKELTQNWKGAVEVVKAEKEDLCFKDGVITVEKYEQAKELGWTDAVIRDELGWNNNSFYGWKRDNGLINQQKKAVRIRDMKASETLKLNIPKVEVNPILTTEAVEAPVKKVSGFDEVLKTEIEEPKASNSQLRKQHEEVWRKLRDKKEQFDRTETAAVEVIKKKNATEMKLKKELETAEHYVNQTQKLNEELQKQVDRLAKELEESKKTDTGNWRELEQQIKVDKEEYEKLARDYEILDALKERQFKRIDWFVKENDRVNELNTMLMLNTLKIVERAGEFQ